MKTLLTVFMLFYMTGCNPGYDATLVVKAIPPNLKLINETNKPLFYLVVDQGVSKDLDIPNPCKDFQPNLEAKGSVTIPYDEIEGADEKTEFAWVYWTNCNGLTDFDTYRLYQN